MHTYNTNPPSDELTNAQNQLAQVKDIMVQNVEQILSRGERIELLVDKTDNMANQATAFRRGARTVRRQMWWKNTRILALSVVVAVVSFTLSLDVPIADRSIIGSHLDHCRTVLWCRSQPLPLVIVVNTVYCFVTLVAALGAFVYNTCAVHSFQFEDGASTESAFDDPLKQGGSPFGRSPSRSRLFGESPREDPSVVLPMVQNLPKPRSGHGAEGRTCQRTQQT